MKLKKAIWLILGITFAHFCFGQENIEIINSTFLGNYQRNYYGDSLYGNLDLNWKVSLGSGKSLIGKKHKDMSGAGWTGQPLLYYEDRELRIVQVSFDHSLKIFDSYGRLLWSYNFDDIIKGTGTLYLNEQSNKKELVIFQGSRLGTNNNLETQDVFSFRALSLTKKKELWRMNVPQGESYSRDVDASPIIDQDTMYQAFENGNFYVINPFKIHSIEAHYYSPATLNVFRLLEDSDKITHGRNVITEASPTLLNNKIYLSSGSGHVYGYNLVSKQIDWDYFIGSDLDGTPVVTKDSAILITIEKEFIKGQGGAMKINPTKSPNGNQCVDWFFPTGDSKIPNWDGGIIGSCSVTDKYNNNSFAAFVGVDGYLYVVDYLKIDSTKTVLGPDNRSHFFKPKLIFKHYVGPSISTPIFNEKYLIVSTYTGIYLFEYFQTTFKLKEFKEGGFESTPFIHNGHIYIASRDGYFYCFGTIKKEELVTENKPNISKSEKIDTKKDNNEIMQERFLLINGSFNDKENAANAAKNLKKNKIQCEVVYIAESSKYYIVLKTCSSLPEAENLKSTFKNNALTKDVWIKRQRLTEINDIR